MSSENEQTRRYNIGVEAAMDVIGGKWKAYILWLVRNEPRRFGELRRLVPETQLEN